MICNDFLTTKRALFAQNGDGERGCHEALGVLVKGTLIKTSMKNVATYALLATSLAFVGCTTYVGVDNPDNSSSLYSNATGKLTTRYKAEPEAVFNAVKRAIDSNSETMKRMGETDHRGDSSKPFDTTVFARAIGDIEIKVNIAKVEDKEKNESYTEVTILYGFFGNCEQSQQLVSKISANLRR